jgi:hypothetical protein
VLRRETEEGEQRVLVCVRHSTAFGYLARYSSLKRPIAFSASDLVAAYSASCSISYRQAVAQEAHNVRCVHGNAPSLRCYPSARASSCATRWSPTRRPVWSGKAMGPIRVDLAGRDRVLRRAGDAAALGERGGDLHQFAQNPSSGDLVDRSVFPKVGSGFWWTSSAVQGQSMNAWAFLTEDGGVATDGYYGTATETRCVR